MIAFAILSSISAAAWCQTEQCAKGADLTLKLEAARAEHGDTHPDVLALAREIRDLQQALLAAHPDQTIEQICDVAPAPAAAAAAPAGPDPNEMICRREQVTGSHRRREVCMTRAQREANRRSTQRELRDRRALDP